METIALDQFVEFRCIGSDCPYTCCGGNWRIDIDEKTDQFYQSCEGEFGEFLNKMIVRKDGKAMFRLTAAGKCPLQDVNGLCSIQIAYGAEHLCDTCRVYPRQHRFYQNMMISHMTLSCPEVARELLQRKTSLHVLQRELNEPDRIPETEAVRIRRKAFRAAIRILQDRECTITQRQRLFLLMSQAVQEAIDAEDYSKADKLLVAFSTPEQYRALAADVGSRGDAAGKIVFLRKFSTLLMTENKNGQLPEIYRRAITYLQDPTADLAAFAEYLSRADAKKQQRAMENLLVGLLPGKYISGFADGNLFRQAIFVLIEAQLYRIFSAVGYAGGAKEEDDRRDSLVVSYVARYFDHSRPEIREQLDRLILEQGLTDLDFLFRLIA